MLPIAVHAQFNCKTNNGTITITGYTGVGGDVSIPSRINGLPVTGIEDLAFSSHPNLTNITIPETVASIGRLVFAYCTSLNAITVDVLNNSLSSVDGVLFDKDQTSLIQYPPGKVGSYAIPINVTNIRSHAFSLCINLTGVTIPHGVASIPALTFSGCFSLTSVNIPGSVSSIGDSAFYHCFKLTSLSLTNGLIGIGNDAFDACTGLTSLSIPGSVTNIGDSAFYACTSLTGLYCRGNAPGVGVDVFGGATAAIVYYLPGTAGWGTTLGGRPTVCWNPQVPTSDPGFGVRTNQFGFTITGANNMLVVVEACPDLINPIWVPVRTNTLAGSSAYFSDPEWSDVSCRFYRLRMP